MERNLCRVRFRQGTASAAARLQALHLGQRQLGQRLRVAGRGLARKADAHVAAQRSAL